MPPDDDGALSETSIVRFHIICGRLLCWWVVNAIGITYGAARANRTDNLCFGEFLTESIPGNCIMFVFITLFLAAIVGTLIQKLVGWFEKPLSRELAEETRAKIRADRKAILKMWWVPIVVVEVLLLFYCPFWK